MARPPHDDILMTLTEWTADEIQAMIDGRLREIETIKTELDVLRLLKEARQLCGITPAKVWLPAMDATQRHEHAAAVEPPAIEIKPRSFATKLKDAHAARVEKVLSFLDEKGSANERQIRQACGITRTQLNAVVECEPRITFSCNTGVYWLNNPTTLAGGPQPHGVITAVVDHGKIVATSIESGPATAAFQKSVDDVIDSVRTAEITGDGSGTALPPIEKLPHPSEETMPARRETTDNGETRCLTEPAAKALDAAADRADAAIQSIPINGGKPLYPEVADKPFEFKVRHPAPATSKRVPVPRPLSKDEIAEQRRAVERMGPPRPLIEVRPKHSTAIPADELDRAQNNVIRYLTESGPQVAAVICKRCGIPRATLSAVIARSTRLKVSGQTGLISVIVAPLNGSSNGSQWKHAADGRKTTRKEYANQLAIYLEAAGPSTEQKIRADVYIPADVFKSLIDDDQRFTVSKTGMICLARQVAESIGPATYTQTNRIRNGA
jgi:hypothetical protein